MSILAIQHAVSESIDARKAALVSASDAIWDHPQVNFHEDYAADMLCSLLEQNGFALEKQLDDMPTAFRATFGSGKPVIAFLGEYDALSALSQQAGCLTKMPVETGAPGHGCGHNLLGVGSLAAALAVKDLIAAGTVSGTVVYFGCPAEETASAKAFLARDGYFGGIDAILTWHPWDYTGIWPGGSLANVKLIFRFKGQAAHAAGSPHLGRSALDALELMNVGVQFLREHVPEDTRIHYAITDAGGASPNVVQAKSEAVYLVRSPRLSDLTDIVERVKDCARGAAIMTGTQVDIEFVKGCSNMKPNAVLGEALIESCTSIGTPDYTADELKFAHDVQATIATPEDTLTRLVRLCDSRTSESVMAHQGEAMYTFVAPHVATDMPIIPVSTDVGDASWCAPTAQISTAAWPAGTPAHSWQVVTCGKSSIAHKAMLYAGKALALTGAKLMSDSELLTRAKREFDASIATHPYVCPIPEYVKHSI